MPGGSEWIIILVVILVIFGGSQLPKLAKNLGKAQREFKDGLSEGEREAKMNEEARAELARAEARRAATDTTTTGTTGVTGTTGAGTTTPGDTTGTTGEQH